VQDTGALVLIGLAVLFIGVSKAGLGGGLGMLTTPVCVLAFGLMGERPQFAVGFLLPLLIVGDLASMWHYWREWRADALKFLLPGVALGAYLGVLFIDRLQPQHFSLIIGVLAIGFVANQFFTGGDRAEGTPWRPTHWAGVPCGVGAGLTSTFAHGAGPVVNMFLLPQRIPKASYVATRVLIFTWINCIKLPFFLHSGLINGRSLRWGAAFCLLVPVGAWLGVRLQRAIPEQHFRRLIYILTLLAGIHLIISSLFTGTSAEERADNFEYRRIEQAITKVSRCASQMRKHGRPRGNGSRGPAAHVPAFARRRALAQWRGLDLVEAEKARADRVHSAASLLPQVSEKIGLDRRRTEAEVGRVWNHLIDPAVTAHAQPTGLRKGTLFVSVDNNVWLSEIVRYRRKEILQRLQTAFSSDLIARISFRIG